MALGVGDLGAEGRAEGVYVAEGHGKVLGVELAGNGQVRGLAEEVLAEVDLAVLGAGRVVGIERGHAEHLPRAFGVGAGDDGRVHIHKAAALEEFMHRVGRHAAHAEDRGEQVGAGAQVLDRAQEFHAVALLLQRIVGRGDALHRDLVRLELKGLLGLRGQHQRAAHDQGGAHVLPGDLIVIVQAGPLKYDLQRLEVAAVVELDKAEVLHVPHRADPAADGHALSVVSLGIGKDRGDFHSFHGTPSFLCAAFAALKFNRALLYHSLPGLQEKPASLHFAEKNVIPGGAKDLKSVRKRRDSSLRSE